LSFHAAHITTTGNRNAVRRRNIYNQGMPTYQTTGIIIGRTNFGEADRIVRMLTADRGKVSAVAKGVRRIKSRLAGHLELFGETQLLLATGRNLDTVASARLLFYPHQLAAAYDRLGLAFVAATATDRLLEPGQPQPELYGVLAELVRALDAGAGGALPELWFKLRLLDTLGYRPELEHCVVCGRHDETTNYAFSPERGGIVCQTDAIPTDHPMPTAAIKLWRLLSDYPYAAVSRVAGASDLSANSLGACDGFYAHHLGRTFLPDQMYHAG
jgi:DNA repair protein RecO (recombination protein O)